MPILSMSVVVNERKKETKKEKKRERYCFFERSIRLLNRRGVALIFSRIVPLLREGRDNGRTDQAERAPPAGSGLSYWLSLGIPVVSICGL